MLVISGMTVFYAQTDSSKICLTYQQFDFYAKSVVERNHLSNDTLIMGKQINEYKNSIRVSDLYSKNLNKTISLKDSIIRKYDLAYKEISDINISLVNKNDRLKKTSLVLAVVSAVLGIIVLLK